MACGATGLSLFPFSFPPIIIHSLWSSFHPFPFGAHYYPVSFAVDFMDRGLSTVRQPLF